MTAQASEILILDGEMNLMRTQPLDRYFEISGHRPALNSPHTACWRGYIGTWEIVDNRLYLVAFKGWRPDYSEMDLTDLFPECSGKVLASWFSGKVELPTGKLLQYIHHGYASIYEKSIILKFRKGVLRSRRVRDNRQSPLSIWMMSIWAKL